MTGRLLCQKLCTLGVRPPALMTSCSNPLAASRKTRLILGNGTCLKTNNYNLPIAARFATTKRASATMGDDIGGSNMHKDERRRGETSTPIGGTTGAGGGGGGSGGGGGGGDDKGTGTVDQLSRKRHDQAPARRPRSRDVFSSLVPAGMFDVWDPLITTSSRSLRQMIETMDRLFDESFVVPATGLERVFTNALRLPWDVVETDDAYLLRVDMPGLGKEEVKIRVEDNELVIYGEHKDVDQNEKELRNYALYNTRVILPKDAKLDEIKAEFENGVLNVVIPKVKDEKKDVKEIQVS